MKAKRNQTKFQQLVHYGKLLVLPHAHNQYRPHLVRRYGLMVLFFVVLSLQLSYGFFKTGDVLGDVSAVTEKELLQKTNESRQAIGVPALAVNDALSRAAALKAEDMLAKQYWAHTAPDGTLPWQWFAKAGYRYSYAGENLAKNFATSSAVVSAWMTSPQHRENVVSRQYTQVGFAVAQGVLDGKETVLVVALYGAPATQGSVSAVSASSRVGSAPLTPLDRIGIALQSLTPAALASLLLLIVGCSVALLAHVYRKKLPKTFRRTWYRHHGIIKAGGMASLCVVVLLLYGGGQI